MVYAGSFVPERLTTSQAQTILVFDTSFKFTGDKTISVSAKVCPHILRITPFLVAGVLTTLFRTVNSQTPSRSVRISTVPTGLFHH
jgi:hypothetical protein